MTCNICKGKGYFHIDEVQAHEIIREYYTCPACDAGKNFNGQLPDDISLSNDNRLSWEERHDVVTMRDNY